MSHDFLSSKHFFLHTYVFSGRKTGAKSPSSQGAVCYVKRSVPSTFPHNPELVTLDHMSLPLDHLWTWRNLNSFYWFGSIMILWSWDKSLPSLGSKIPWSNTWTKLVSVSRGVSATICAHAYTHIKCIYSPFKRYRLLEAHLWICSHSHIWPKSPNFWLN